MSGQTLQTIKFRGYVITEYAQTFSAGAGPELAGKTLPRWEASKGGRVMTSGHVSLEAVKDAVRARIAEDKRVTLRFADGSQRTLRAGTAKDVQGLDFLGNVVVRDEYIGLYPLTPCCDASGKGGEYGVMCRSCYVDVDDYYGGSADVAVPLA